MLFIITVKEVFVKGSSINKQMGAQCVPIIVASEGRNSLVCAI